MSFLDILQDGVKQAIPRALDGAFPIATKDGDIVATPTPPPSNVAPQEVPQTTDPDISKGQPVKTQLVAGVPNGALMAGGAVVGIIGLFFLIKALK